MKCLLSTCYCCSTVVLYSDAQSGAFLSPLLSFSCPPVFVPRPGASQEDDGLLVVDLAASDGSGVLVFLCGRTLREVARARLPKALPAGQHAAFYPSPDLQLGPLYVP